MDSLYHRPFVAVNCFFEKVSPVKKVLDLIRDKLYHAFMKIRHITKKDEAALMRKFETNSKVAEALSMTRRMWLYIKARQCGVSPRVQSLIDYRLGK